MLHKPASRLALTIAALIVAFSSVWIFAASVAPSDNRVVRLLQAVIRPLEAVTGVSVAAAAEPEDDHATPPVPANQAAESKQSADEFSYTSPTTQPIATVVRHFWPTTRYMTRAELETALRQVNNLGKATTIKKDQKIVIPGYEEKIVVRAIPTAPDFEVRAVYLTGTMAGSQLGLNLVQRWRQAGGNTIVFDIKDSDGTVNVPFEHALAPHHSPAIPNLPKYVRHLHSLGMHAIARIALFRDEALVVRHPDLAVKSRRSGQAWSENGKLVWTDSSHPKVQEYNLELARQVAASGVDEIQFDYVRFPAEGDQKDTQFAFEAEHPKWARSDVITDFVARAYSMLHPTGVLVSLDVFGVTAWQEPRDLAKTGQDVARLARHCDVLSPMIYPSHFFGMEGYELPGDAPEHFISESMDRFTKLLAVRHEENGTAAPVSKGTAAPAAPNGGGVPSAHELLLPSATSSAAASSAPAPAGPVTHAVLRPWLQAFGWRTKTYGVDYIVIQVRSAKDHGGVGFLFWNARNDYGKPIAAMSMMRATPGRFFRGDELPGFSSSKATEATSRP